MNFKIFSLLRKFKKEPTIIDSRVLLSHIDRSTIIQRLSKEKHNVPGGFSITNQTMEEKNLSEMPAKDKNQLFVIRSLIETSPHQSLTHLLLLKEKYPNVPVIYNYLTIVYAYTAKENERLNTILETCNKFPDYFFGKISLAQYYLNIGKYEQVPGVFNNNLQIQAHFPPDTKLFHISEVRGFYAVLTEYYQKMKMMDHALYYYFTLYDLEPKHKAVKILANRLIDDTAILSHIKKQHRKL